MKKNEKNSRNLTFVVFPLGCNVKADGAVFGYTGVLIDEAGTADGENTGMTPPEFPHRLSIVALETVEISGEL